MHAARAHVGLKLGMLHLDLRYARARIGVIRKADPVVELEDGIRGHRGLAVVGQRHGLGLRIEVVFHMALRAGGGLGVERLEVCAHRVGQVGMRHDELAARVGMAVVAADALVDLGEHVLKGNGIRADALIVHLRREVRRLAGEAVRELVRTAGAGHVLDRVVVAARAVVILVEGHALVDGSDHRVFLDVVDRRVVFRVPEVGRIHVGIGLRPVSRFDDGDARSCLGDGRRLGGRTEHDQAQGNEQPFLHGTSPFLFRRATKAAPLSFHITATGARPRPHTVYRRNCQSFKRKLQLYGRNCPKKDKACPQSAEKNLRRLLRGRPGVCKMKTAPRHARHRRGMKEGRLCRGSMEAPCAWAA